MNTYTKDTIIITKHSQFYRAVNEGEIRYYGVFLVGNKERACEFDSKKDPVIVQGFAVYDTKVSTQYAIALAGSQEEADSIKQALAQSSVEQATLQSIAHDEQEAIDSGNANNRRKRSRK